MFRSAVDEKRGGNLRACGNPLRVRRRSKNLFEMREEHFTFAGRTEPVCIECVN